MNILIDQIGVILRMEPLERVFVSLNGSSLFELRIVEDSVKVERVAQKGGERERNENT